MTAAIDAHALCSSDEIGPGVTIGPFTVVSAEAAIGANATLGSHVVVGPGVRVGEDVLIGSGAVIAAGVEIGRGAVIADGAVVSRSVPRATVVEGNPARISGYAGIGTGLPIEPVRQRRAEQEDASAISETSVRGVQLHRLPAVRDLRGSLVAGELEQRLPFVARRFFIVHDVPGAEVRGEHAHYACHQFLICVSGQVHVIADDGESREEFVLDDNRTGVYLPPMTWGTQYRYSADCSLLVLASHPYDASDYIRDYDVYLEALREDRADG